jgi:hypothetical protein
MELHHLKDTQGNEKLTTLLLLLVSNAIQTTNGAKKSKLTVYMRVWI